MPYCCRTAHTVIDPNDYFVFDDKIIDESRRKVNNLAIENGYKDRWNSLTVEEFNNYFQDAELLPYSPIYSPAQISGEIESCGKDIERIIKISDKWLQEARNYAVRYNFNETESICNVFFVNIILMMKKNNGT